MVQSYLLRKMTEPAVFELFVRRLPEARNFLIAAGAEQLVSFLETLHFTTDELAWLRETGRYQPELLDYLQNLEFTGDVEALSEGTPFFPLEPIIRIRAPLSQAQLIESRLMNLIHFETVIASKAARAWLVAGDKLLVDFGLRRAHGAEAALLAARASYIGGYSGTSTVLAGKEFGIPIYGTMAHSFIQAHPSEEAAFRDFAQTQKGPFSLLIDTYDTEAAAEKVAALAPEFHAQGLQLRGVRLDSGDLAEHAQRVRRIFDQHGLKNLQIFVSGNLDERKVQELLQSKAPIDGFGVGTKLTTSADAPYLDCAYKLQEYAGEPKRKRSEGKATLPGSKQVWRYRSSDGVYQRDEIRLESEGQLPDAEPLLKPLMRNGKRLGGTIPVSQIRDYCLNEIRRLPAEFHQLSQPASAYPVQISQSLQGLVARLDRESSFRRS